MLKSVLVVGCKGSMGRRYGAILKFLDIEWEGIDVGQRPRRPYDGVILATPTENHIDDIEYYSPDCPVLCEKPFSKDMALVKNVCGIIKNRALSLRMVNQYAYLTKPGTTGPSFYSFYNHGKDTLAWDCINIIGLAEGAVHLDGKSPLWHCMINGQSISIADMDEAYIKMVRDWVNGGFDNVDYILSAHAKVHAYLEATQ